MSIYVFSLSEMLCDEMQARGWTTDDVGARMHSRDPALDTLIFSTIISVSQRDDRLRISDDDYAGLARAFGVSETYFRNIHNAWLNASKGRQDFVVPDDVFGPWTRAALGNAEAGGTP